MKNINEEGILESVCNELDLPANYEELSPLEKAQAMRKAKKEAGEEEERLNPMERALKTPTPMNCIKAKCYECMGGDVGWKWQIGNCTSYSCPLRPLRPYKTMEGKPRG